MSNQFVLDPPWANPGNRGDYGPDATEEDLEQAKAEAEEAEAEKENLPENIKVNYTVNINFFPEGPASENFVQTVGDPAIVDQAIAAAKYAEENPPDETNKSEKDEMGNPIIEEGEGTPNDEQVDESEPTPEPVKSTTTDNYV
jgi:hypothetical protein